LAFTNRQAQAPEGQPDFEKRGVLNVQGAATLRYRLDLHPLSMTAVYILAAAMESFGRLIKPMASQSGATLSIPRNEEEFDLRQRCLKAQSISGAEEEMSTA
jgi:hypothetical protein